MDIFQLWVIFTQLFTEMCKVKSDREINLEIRQLDIKKGSRVSHPFQEHFKTKEREGVDPAELLEMQQILSMLQVGH